MTSGGSAPLASRSPTAPPAELRVRVIGPFAVEGVDLGTLPGRKSRTLLKALALARGGPVASDTLVEVLWPTGPPSRPRDQLAVLASRIRSLLGSQRLVRTGGGYALAVDWLDLVELEELRARARDRLGGGKLAAARAASAAALGLLRGPLLADEPDAEWVEADRRALERLEADVLAIAAEAELAAGAPVAAADHAARALDLDPYDEHAARLLMRAHAEGGRPASALAAYARLRERLRDDLGVSPAPATEQLHADLLGTEPVERRLAVRPSPASHRTRREDIVGRRAALDELDAAAAGAIEGRATVLLVEGEAGMGKTTLVDAWRASLADRDLAVLHGSADGLGRLPLQVVLDALAGHLTRCDAAEVRRLLGPDTEELAPLLGVGERVDAPRPARHDHVHDAPALRELLFLALVGVVERLGEQRPVVLVIDDLHDADDATIEWLRLLRRRFGRGRLLVVATTRPGLVNGLEVDATVVVEPLTLADAVELVGEERAPTLLARSGGNTLFFVELAAGTGEEIPGSIAAAVEARVRGIGDARRSLETAAVLGPCVDVGLVADALGREAMAVLDDLEVALRHRFLDEEGAEFVFRHALVREAIESTVSAPRRTLLHRAAAEVLDRRPDADPFEVARHALAGGDGARGAAALRRAAMSVAARFDAAGAERLLDESIELHDSPAARRQRAEVRMSLGRYRDALEDAERAIELAAVPEQANAEVAAWAAYYSRDFDAALAYARAAGGGTAVQARILHARGALGEAESAFEIAVGAPDALERGLASAWFAILRCHQGRTEEALHLARAALRSRPVLAHPFGSVHAHINEGYALGLAGRPDAALAALDRADAVADRSGQGDRYGPAIANWRAWVLRYVGAVAEAEACSEAALDAEPFVEARAHALLDLADARLLTDRPDEAAAFLARAEPLHDDDHAMRWRHALRAQLLGARVDLALGDDAAAAERAEAVIARAQALRLDRYVVLGNLVAAWARSAAAAVDPSSVAPWLERLGRAGGGEAWWWSARFARLTGDDGLRALASAQVAAVAPHAGPRRAGLLAAAGAALGDG